MTSALPERTQFDVLGSADGAHHTSSDGPAAISVIRTFLNYILKEDLQKHGSSKQSVNRVAQDSVTLFGTAKALPKIKKADIGNGYAHKMLLIRHFLLTCVSKGLIHARMPSSTILIVDDFESFRQFVCLLLEQRPEFQVIGHASDGLEAIQKAKELRPDLILLDIGLPKLNGIETAKRLRKVTPQTRILFLSQESSSDVVQETLRLGALGYVLKTRAGNELLPAMETVLRGQQFISSGLKGYECSDKTNGQNGQHPYRHEILFCSDDSVLLDSFTRVVATALNTGNAAIVLATESHRTSLLCSLKKQGLDIDQAIQEGTYIVLDVAEALSAIMVNGLPDPVRFFGGIRGFIETAAKAAKAKEPRVVVCGEGVAILQAEGKANAAIRLEQLCDELAKTHKADVLCAHPLNSFQTVEH
jgi:DNA-binding NarL/FixJ family response regulator